MEDRETLVYGFVDDVYVILHRGDRVDEREWQLCIDGALYSASAPRVLLVAGDLMPDVGQRYDLGRLHEKHGGIKAALVSDSPSIRRVVTALKWSGIEAESFRMDDLDGVLAFLARPSLRARLSSALGPYLDRSWLHEVGAPASPSLPRARQSAAHRGIS
jgi:hypothetical protein